MKLIKRSLTVLLAVLLSITRILGDQIVYEAATAPTSLWVEPTDINGIPARIDVWKAKTGGTNINPTYIYQLYLPGGIELSKVFLCWDGDSTVTINNVTYTSGNCPIAPLDNATTYNFKYGNSTAALSLVTYQGSPDVQRVFIEIDESEGHNTIAQMDNSTDHSVECTGQININGSWYELTKMKGRGNATWSESLDKKPYNITLNDKINFPGVDSDKSKKWSLMAEVLDHSLLGNRIGFSLAHVMGIGQDATHADVWMNGEYQGCYMVTPKTDSFVTKDGYMIEQDNYKEDSVADGGDPQFTLEGLKEASGWSSCYNRITVKKMGDNLLKVDGVVDESPTNLTYVAENVIRPWLQAAWNAIRFDDGYYNGKYYTEYIDIESFAKMYLMHEYIKSYDVCAGSILFHRDGSGETDKLYAGPLWDLDNAMGSVFNNRDLGAGSDRRSGSGDFIQIITEYKTSIYKTISKHADFMEEVSNQYNKYRDYFDNLENVMQDMMDEIEKSAMMNHMKVTDKGHGQGDNNHYYGSTTTLGTGQYRQTYYATTNSKTDWPIYANNMKTYIHTRSLWFHNNYWDENYCVHDYATVVTPPTCISTGYTTYTCTKCGDSYVGNPTPIIEHDYQEGVCTVCGQLLYNVTIVRDTGVNITVYNTQDVNGESILNPTEVHPRNKDTGFIDCSGDGQVNFSFSFEPGYEYRDLTATPKNYNKLNTVSEENNVYRTTKVTGDFTITVKAYTYITFDANTGTETMESQKINVNEEEELAPNAFKKDHYSFTGWNTKADGTGASYLDGVTVTLNAPTTLYAQWEIDKHDVVFKNADGTIIQNTKVAYGDMPVYSGETPVKESDVQYNYVFTGWSPAITVVTGNATYTAVYDSILREYKITFVNYDGTVLQSGDVAYGTTLAYTGTTPTKPADKDYYYTFSAWTPAIVSTSGEATYTAAYASTERTYGTPVWSWMGSDADGYTSATATFTTDDGHEEFTQTVNAVPTSAMVDPDCVTDGKTTYTASVTFRGNQYSNVKEVTITKLGHDYVATVTEPTCTERGYTTHTCTRCNDSYIDTFVDELGHSWGQWQVTVAPTYTEKGTQERECSRCHLKQQAEIAALSHTEGETVIENNINPTCTKDGSYDSVVYCTVCDAELSREKVIVPATGHTPGQPHHENEEGSSCTEPGSYDEVVRCTVCDTVLSSEHKIVDALGHNWGQWHQTKAPTCTEKGTDTRECTRCDAKETRDVDPLGHTAADAVKENNVEPKCTEEGGYDMVEYCSVCGHELSRVHEVVPATGHTRGEVHNEDEVPASCTEQGTYNEVIRCTVCNEIISSVPKTTDPLGHDWGQWQVKVAPTCTENGVEVRECTRCDARETRDVDPHGHTPGESVKENEVSPTCIKEGSYDSVVYCTVCHAELSREKVIIPATGHTSGEPVHEHEVAPTCTTEGSYDEVIYCTVCHEKLSTEHKTVKATGHTPGEPKHENETKATCISEGSYDEVVRCTTCNKILLTERKTEKALGHSYGEWKYDGEEAKTHTRLCSNDPSHKETENCQFDDGKIVGDITTYTCMVCGGTYEVKNEKPSEIIISRIAGDNRFATSQDIATIIKENSGADKLEAVILASGDNFADALAGSYLSAVKNAPIILTRAGKETEVNKYIRSILKSNGTVYVLGGTAAVPESCLNGLTGKDYVIKRLAGDNRYLTDLAILKEAGMTEDTIMVSVGDNFADSLSASASGMPILLVKDKLTDDQKQFLSNYSNKKVVILGGTKAVSKTIESEMKKYGTVVRIEGANRYETSTKIAEQFYPDANTIVMAVGDNFPDGLCGGALAYQLNAPVVLIKDGRTEYAKKYVVDNDITNGIVLGGTSAVKDAVANDIFGRDADALIKNY